jgi:Ca-activated chloride channel family protein
MYFMRPDYGWWLLMALVVVLVIWWKKPGRYAASTTIGWVDSASRASPLRRLPSLALLAALVFTGLAFMQPSLPFVETEVRSRGVDLVMVLDLSSSMLEPIGLRARARSLGPIVEGSGPTTPIQTLSKTRLDATKDAIRKLAARRLGDRLGLVVFSGNAYIVSPLSADHDYLERYVDLIDPNTVRGGGTTAVGEGLALANYLLVRQALDGDTRGRVVVLFTDGATNRGRDPVEVLEQSDAAGVRVHVVGVDVESGAVGWDTDAEAPIPRAQAEVDRLVAAVEGYGGLYFDANSEADLEAATETIDEIEKGVLVSTVYTSDVPVYHWFVIPALLCLALTLVLGMFPYFTDLT